MAGRRPKHTALRLIDGNAGKRPPARALLQRDDAEVGATMPRGLTEAAQRHWRDVAQQLTDARILTRLDALALAQYCEVFARWRDAADELAQNGPMIETDLGGVKTSPHWSVFIQAAGEMRRMLIEFGMTPSARARVAAIGKKQDADPFDDFD